jgi:AcrR family transcriptional regulator
MRMAPTGQNVLMMGKHGAIGTQPPGGGARVRNRWGQGERLRAEILTAAGQLLGELGTVDGLTLREVARRAGIAPASIYTQFADRVALIDALLAYEHERVADLMRQAGAETDPASGIRSQLYAFCRYSLAKPGHYRLMFGLDGGQRTSMLRTLVEQLSAALMAYESGGARLRLPADRAAIVLLVGTHGRVAISHVQSETDAEEKVLRFVDELVGLVFDVSPSGRRTIGPA